MYLCIDISIYTYIHTYIYQPICLYVVPPQVHDPEFAPSVDVILNETLPALQKLKEEGKIRLIGMTGYPLALQQV